MKSYIQILSLATFASAFDLMFLNEDLQGLSKRASSTCSNGCPSASDTITKECGDVSGQNFETTTKFFNCLCHLGGSFWDDLSTCVKDCSDIDTQGIDTSPSGLQSLYCQTAQEFSSLLEEFSGSIPSAFNNVGNQGLGFANAAGSATGETETSPSTLEATTTKETTNGSATTKETTNGSATNGKTTTSETSSESKASESKTTSESKTSSETTSGTKNDAMSMGVGSFLYLMAVALL
ncbi:uncharacterized protein J8A68_004410 [[Candida] subhashii]|uniref:Uncharacterized protein n=1 Tax=[Candida] subhashii TaxID=561895 RepID=A0A8J5QFH5_9ASCO|nr:uncharacterized protein J8A68_004410 [[Candida] subhashii]KAG7662022.1 hypothetical protein J8A68_004410 [[Candida] subhashii]